MPLPHVNPTAVNHNFFFYQIYRLKISQIWGIIFFIVNNSIFPVLEPLTPGGSTEKLEVTKEVVKQGGLGVITAAIFLAGEMAGSGVLALPAAMLGTSRNN